MNIKDLRKKKKNESSKRWMKNNPGKAKDSRDKWKKSERGRTYMRVIAHYNIPYWFAFKKILNGCDICDYRPSHVLDFHHIDLDRKNDDLNNISYLCPNCHAKVHRPDIDFKSVRNRYAEEMENKQQKELFEVI